MAFRVVDAQYAYDRALKLGAKPVQTQTGPNELEIPAIEGIGGLQIYLVDRYGQKGSIYDVDFEWLGEPDPRPHGVGLHYIDHLTHNVYRGRLNEWAAFYEKLFNLRQIPSRSSYLFGPCAEQATNKLLLPVYRDAGLVGRRMSITAGPAAAGLRRCQPHLRGFCLRQWEQRRYGTEIPPRAGLFGVEAGFVGRRSRWRC
ncbi:hypothetical protein [Microvirga subterranea]|uniref:Hydroxyphenylpyruvate dioxygenase-like protein n=1 Tax=Microvirga subterranea TaxID=186651 RepID=A0A370HE21_9HYPH|nr:hypothetical protein [Microvirga subterranea]RDI54867.1 hydroxyphenylpyruvate dioxygenase-like protein [Microvirga subterranea]